ncbi:Tn3 family transposase [Fischerella thermalis]|uniref:Tn3 family transposase n=1 Tax=Fischerella thermalis CCMEE 5318 TaxID=2019666 RepID=A0A2N6LN33_9CYAN|nr:Tn3 family transposase [Fischerella thermalis]PMB26810.1 Tn3 family transposase [Fischerella thermalis CCMEE 5318]
MTLIDRTAYPKFKQYPDPKELAELYTPTSAEIKFAKSRTKSHEGFLCFMVMLKSFQRLGYFPHPECVPNAVIKHLRSCLKLQSWVKAIPSQRQGYTYQRAIRSYLGVKQYDKTAQKLIAILVAQQAEVKDHPADLINVAIEELVKERYELPAFGTLDRLIGHIRTFVNNRLFGRVNNGLSSTEMLYLDQLLLGDIEESIATLNLLKSPPKSATFKGMKQLLTKFDALMSFGDAKRLLGSIALTKIRYFAAQARALDISELRDVNLPKRRTLLLCLLYEAQVKTRDHIVSMFLKRVLKIQNNAKQRLQELREKHLAQTSELLGTLAEVLTASKEAQDAQSLGTKVQSIFDEHGGPDLLLQKYEEIAAYNTNNHLPLMWRFYSPHRKVLFDLVRSLDILSTSADESVIDALSFILDNEHKRGRHLPFEIDLSFVSKQWRALVIQQVNGTQVLVRQQLEICIFSYLADDFKAGDACVVGSLSYADFREQLLSESECEPLISEYCRLVGFPDNAEDFVEHLRESLTQVAEEVDAISAVEKQVTINQAGEPVLKRITPLAQPQEVEALEAKIRTLMPERSILDILCNVEHWLNWTKHFGPFSGSEPKLKQPVERYIFTTFSYGCNLGPNQMARHSQGAVTSHMISYTNRRHVSTSNIEAAIRDIINAYNRFSLPSVWGTGKRAAADGSKFEIYENNLHSEYHIRYGGYGGIAYHHVSDKYIALFTHFITCGVWEAVYILDGLLKNLSDIQPDTLHADTQGQSGPVFAISYLLGIKLMPRIRNWKDHAFVRPSEDVSYKYLDPLFKGVVNWNLIKTHWYDMMRVVLSIKAGKVMPSTLLRKLGSYSRKNRLYQAFLELGKVVRTMFLLEYISNMRMRSEINAITNIVEMYHAFLDWVFFGKEGAITENDPIEQEKRLKYLDLVASAVILQNTVDMSLAIQTLAAQGEVIHQLHVAALSPYVNRHIKRYGDYVVNLRNIPQPLEVAISLPPEIFEI